MTQQKPLSNEKSPANPLKEDSPGEVETILIVRYFLAIIDIK
jgi:hypothetical protein